MRNWLRRWLGIERDIGGVYLGMRTYDAVTKDMYARLEALEQRVLAVEITDGVHAPAAADPEQPRPRLTNPHLGGA